MIPVFSAAGRRLVTEFLQPPTLLAFDFDGTLAPIVGDRSAAAMRASTEALMARLCREHEVVVISGRARADVLRRLGALRLRAVVGNHGMETGDLSPGFTEEARWIERELTLVLHGQGADVEAKGLSCAVHLRRGRSAARARALLTGWARSHPERVRMLPGKSVLNVLPAGAPNKGDALLRLMPQAAAERAIYVGDDATDEDVFRLSESRPILSVQVGPLRRSAATLGLPSQRAVDRFLALLLECSEQQR